MLINPDDCQKLAKDITDLAYRIMPEDMTIPIRLGDTWHIKERQEIEETFFKFLREWK
jgi:hypothetical protein